ncbi:motility associated factor glycosyltransferase family protein [Desulfitibacter alkalitolerans]|uniref:motility associated factor glycosyltransferase family protein n=1 Tax=Desulfitibacter alkalitolerans TaxID=264641 RepID=UPI000484DB05|nr:6-hydroxymethylpterin diphosphokinase MptE-like protein [Desulfitibacter alkalitolerans]
MIMILARENQTKEMFNKNLQLLSPWLRETVLKIDEKELWEKVQVTYDNEGYPICRYHQEHTSFLITSQRPIQEAQQWSEAIAVQGAGAIFMYGSGFGYSLFEIFRRKQPHTLVVLFEQNIYLFAAMLHYFDLEPIISTQKIAFLIGDIECFARAFDQLFFSIVFANCTSPVLAFTPVAQRNFKDHYMQIHKYIFSQLGLFVFYIGNDHLDNLIGLHNLLSNTKEIVKNPYLSCLKDKYQDVPAFIIANGPSLDKNIQQLKKVKDKGLIICAESAIIPLIRNNIKPDILTIIERTKYTYTYHFENIDYPEDMALLCLGLVDKRVYPSFCGAKIPIFRHMEAINQWLNKHLGDGSALDAGANVSHLALELAVYLGANPIVFVGQDYAYGPEGITHSKASVYFEEKGKRARELLKSKPIIHVESNEGTMIPSNQLWTDFKKGLEHKIATHSHKIIINSTEGGARIKGTRCEPLAYAIKKYCNRPIPHKVHEVISQNKKKVSVAERKQGLLSFIKSVEGYAGLFRKLRQEATHGRLACREMIRLSQEKDIAKHRNILEETYQKHINTYQLFIADDLCRCFSQQVIFVYFYLMNRLGLIDTSDKITEIFRIQHDFFHHLNIVCQSVSVHLEDAIETLKGVLEELDNSDYRGEDYEQC